MRKLKLLLVTLALIVGGIGSAWATDYLTNFSDYTETRTAVSNTGASGNTQEYWRGGILDFDISGSSTTIPNGVYSFSVQAVYRGHYTKDVPTGIIAYAESAGSQYMVPVCNYTDGPAPASNNPEGFNNVFSADPNNFLNTIPYIIVTDGKIKVGVKSMSTQPFCDNGMWFLFNKTSFKVSDVTDEGVLATAFADIKAQATGLLESNSETSDARTALETAAAATDPSAANIVDIKQKIDAYLAFLANTATQDTPYDVSYYFTNPKYAIRNLDLVGGLVTSGKTGALGQPFGWTCFDAGGTVDNGSGNCFQDAQGYNWFSTIGNTTAIDGRTANYDTEKTGGYSIYQRISWNQWAEQTHSAKQTVTLPAGKYKISVPAYASENSDDYKGYVIFTIGNTKEDNTVTAGSWNVYEKTFILTETTDVCVDMQFNKLRRAENKPAAWAFFDGITLTAYGDPLNDLKAQFISIKGTASDLLSNATYNNVVGTERATLSAQSTATAAAETLEAYQTAIDAVQDAINDFTAAKINYDVLVAEIAKAKALGMAAATADGYAANASSTAATTLTNTQGLKVAEYTYVTTTYQHGVALGEWTSEATNTSAATFDNQHWSGTTHEYKNQNDNDGQGWNNNSGWSIDFNQNVTLPAGNYVFKVAGRRAPGDAMTMSLIVKNGDDELGKVDDFPQSNNSRGINKSGETAFDGDNANFANGGAGFGWEWRYVKFTLATDATVNLSIKAVATAGHQWLSFGDYTLQTDNEANISLIAYNIALNNANTVINSTTYAKVGGTDKSELQDAIDADATLDKTDKDAIDAAKTTLEAKTHTFTTGVDSWNTYDATKTQFAAYTKDLPYASPTKLTAFTTALAAEPTTAADATTKKDDIITTYRKYVESNALAEGVTSAESVTILNPNLDAAYTSADHKFGAWEVIGQTNGTIQWLNSESFTDGDGNSNYKYADIYKSDNNAGIQQTVNLQPGKYILTVTARANTTADAAFWVFAGNKTANINRIGNSGGVFDRGWNDATVEFVVNEASDVNIGVQSGNGKDLWWSATRFRLTKIAGVENLNMTITDAEWATFIAPFDVTIPDGVKAYTVEGINTDGETLDKTEVTTGTIEANTPVLLNGPAGTYPVSGVNIADEKTYKVGALVGVYVSTQPVSDGEYDRYVLQNLESTGLGFYKVSTNAADAPTVGINRAYLEVAKSPVSAKMLSFTDDDETTIIEGIDAANAGEYDIIYNALGIQVESLQKGLNIVVKDGKSYKIYVK